MNYIKSDDENIEKQETMDWLMKEENRKYYQIKDLEKQVRENKISIAEKQ